MKKEIEFVSFLEEDPQISGYYLVALKDYSIIIGEWDSDCRCWYEGTTKIPDICVVFWAEINLEDEIDKELGMDFDFNEKNF